MSVTFISIISYGPRMRLPLDLSRVHDLTNYRSAQTPRHFSSRSGSEAIIREAGHFVVGPRCSLVDFSFKGLREIWALARLGNVLEAVVVSTS